MRIKAYHGGRHDNPYWFTTDRKHAACFGDPRQYEIVVNSHLVIDAKRDRRLRDLDGWSADQELYMILEDAGVDALLVKGWEGHGTTILLADSSRASEIR